MQNCSEGRWLSRQEEVAQLLVRVLTLNPKTEIASALLGEIMFDMGNWTEAKKILSGPTRHSKIKCEQDDDESVSLKERLRYKEEIG